MSDDLERQIKEVIVDALMLEDVRPEDIDSDEALFLEGLGLDSIDALELAIAIDKKFKVRLKPDDEASRKAFASVRSLADYITAHLPAGAGS